jgi:hypothetical protein
MLFMPKVTFVLGLCGSGKSFFAQDLHKRSGARVFENLLSDRTGAFYREFLQYVEAGHDSIVDEYQYCMRWRREEILQDLSTVPELETEWFCFENDLQSANWNVSLRTNKTDPEGHRWINEWLTSRYTFPDNATILPIARLKIAATR